ncbi:MAG: enoyl-CoA hydratase/isomerase family protein [Spirochaetes bacterium]|nr:enoyl-CoA hydratase/isomerase family protein [Spirochaetota bacterium]
MLKEQIEDNIVIATFEKGKNNSLDVETLQSLKALVKKANEDPAIKGIVFTGAGRTFCSGFDLPLFLSFKDHPEVIKFFTEVEDIFIDLFMCKKPVVAAINGAAVAGGLILSMACDYRIIKNHPKIKVGMSEIKIGLGLSVVQTEIMKFGLDGNKKFRDVMYFGQLHDVAAAREMALVDEVVEEAELMTRAKQVVLSWADNPGGAFKMLKTSFRTPTADLMRKRLKDEDWQEGFKCFFDPATRKTLEMVSAMMGQ